MVLKIKDSQQIIPYLAKLPFKNSGDIKTFVDEQKLREIITSKLSLQEIPQKSFRLKLKNNTSNSNSHKEIKSNNNDYYIGKFFLLILSDL